MSKTLSLIVAFTLFACCSKLVYDMNYFTHELPTSKTAAYHEQFFTQFVEDMPNILWKTSSLPPFCIFDLFFWTKYQHLQTWSSIENNLVVFSDIHRANVKTVLHIIADSEENKNNYISPHFTQYLSNFQRIDVNAFSPDNSICENKHSNTHKQSLGMYDFVYANDIPSHVCTSTKATESFFKNVHEHLLVAGGHFVFIGLFANRSRSEGSFGRITKSLPIMENCLSIASKYGLYLESEQNLTFSVYNTQWLWRWQWIHAIVQMFPFLLKHILTWKQLESMLVVSSIVHAMNSNDIRYTKLTFRNSCCCCVT